VEELLTTEQTAKILGFAPQTLKGWRVSGCGPEFIKIGNAVRYRRDDLTSWLNSKPRKKMTFEG
jgi:predicted DNA-binding transcriptional regulator AlpA